MTSAPLSGIPVAGIGTALYVYSSVLAALYERERTGRGAVIPIAMLDVAAEMMGSALNQVLHGEWRRLTKDLLDRPDLAEIQRRADEARLGNARPNGVRDLAEHDQLKQRGRWRQVGTPGGPVPALRPPALATGWPVISGRVPALGEDTEAIRAEVGEPR
jgi:itaconate CoA-transferase